MPKLVTFCSDTSQVEVAITAGCTHLILEDSKLSIRSFSDDFLTPTLEKISQLSHRARQLSPAVELSINCDFLAHDTHFLWVKKAILIAKDCGIRHFRVQDPGVGVFIRDSYPNAFLTLATETGNQNLHSIGYWCTLFDSQELGIELPYEEIEKTVAAYPDYPFGLQVQGPILIQYSFRRFLEGRYHHKKPLVASAQDQEYPGRSYRFYDTEHGHFMYLYFDRCLYPYMEKLSLLRLSSWLVDARGESLGYLKESLALYKQEGSWDVFLSETKRPQKPGFFLANLTDQTREIETPFSTDGFEEWGVIVDVAKPYWITVKPGFYCNNPIAAIIATPEGKKIHIDTLRLYDVNLNPIHDPASFSLIRLPYLKGVTTQSRVFVR